MFEAEPGGPLVHIPESKPVVPVHMPERKPLVAPVDKVVLRKLSLFNFGISAPLLSDLDVLINFRTYKDAVLVLTSNVARAKTAKVSFGELVKVGWKGSAARRNMAGHPHVPMDSLDFYQLLRSRLASHRLAVYYLVMEKMNRSRTSAQYLPKPTDR